MSRIHRHELVERPPVVAAELPGQTVRISQDQVGHIGNVFPIIVTQEQAIVELLRVTNRRGDLVRPYHEILSN